MQYAKLGYRRRLELKLIISNQKCQAFSGSSILNVNICWIFLVFYGSKLNIFLFSTVVLQNKQFDIYIYIYSLASGKILWAFFTIFLIILCGNNQ